MKKDRIKIYFTSDLHFSHKNILKYSTNRLQSLGLDINDKDVLVNHDNRIIEKWNNLINKCDIVYILGDFSFASVDDTKKILNKLNGQKHLIIGNHDGSCRSLTNYFQSVSHIKEVTFKKTVYPFLDETIHCVLCHYPLLTWNRRQHGSFNIHGHCHNNLFEFNNKSGELRVDIGFDSALAEQNNNFVELEELYYYFKNIRNEHNCETFEKYAKLVIENNKIDL